MSILINVLLAAWVLVEAIRRLAHPANVSGSGLLVVATLGLVVNLGSAWLLHRVGTKSLNVRGAFLHLAADALGSLGAMVAGAVILIWDNHRADPIVSILISGLVVWAGLRLLFGSGLPHDRPQRPQPEPGSPVVDLDSVSWRTDGPLDRRAILDVLAGLPPAVYRAKGVVRYAW